MSLLSLRDLTITLPTPAGPRPVVRDVSFELAAHEALALVGESGSGKSMTVRSLLRLLPQGAQVSGEIRYDGADVMAMSGRELRALRGGRVGMVFQDPRAAVNPVRTIGDFLTERLGRGAAARARAQALLEEVGVPQAARRLRQYPHELSGGLLQRAMIASVLAAEPELILADEPTTALDVTTQAEVMALLDELRRERGLALLLITHDLELAAAVCSRTLVMYAGGLVEDCPSQRLHERPLHPYSAALGASRPDIAVRRELLPAIPGRPVSALEAPPGCAFAPRCAFAQDRCREQRPPLRPLGDDRVACVRAEELTLHG